MVVSLEDNFWQLNQDYKYLSPFKELYEYDEDKDYTSRIAWSVYLYCDVKSKFRKLNDEERKAEIEQHFMKAPIFDLEIVEFLIQEYDEFEMSEVERMFKLWQDKIKQRTDAMRDMDFSLAGAKEYDDMLLRSGKIVQAYMEAKSKYESEKAGDRLTGGAKRSFIEQR